MLVPQLQATQTQQVNHVAHPEAVVVAWASTPEEVREVQSLRYQVFSKELGVHLKGQEGLDEDQFDAYALHLYAREMRTGQVVGTYRVLTRECTSKVGFYSAQEFDISDFLPFQESILEVGRACVHKDYRNGTVLMALWKAVLEYTVAHQYQMILGCTSVPISSQTPSISDTQQLLQSSGAMSEDFRVIPRNPVDLSLQPPVDAGVPLVLPPLFKGYLRLGAQVCGAPTYDPDFHTADFLTILQLSKISPRYVKHFNLTMNK